jgi:glycosyltransferase involved in cell wall biosynthesis
MNIGIDATNLGEGGGITHLKEILLNFNTKRYKNKIDTIVIFSSYKVLDLLPDYDFIDKVSFPNLNRNLLYRVWFQLTQFDAEIEKRCDILFSITGDYIGNFKYLVGMSQNMLLYERDIWKEIKQPKEIIRFWLNYKKQKKCFKKSKGIIFISKYAKNYISNILDLDLKLKTIIHHGISSRFLGGIKEQRIINSYTFENPFKILYVSTVHVYKHHPEVIKAVSLIREKGIPIELNLVGSVIFSPAGKKMFDIIKDVDPKGEFIHYHGNVSYKVIEGFYLNTNAIIYASTCENMPNILIESMASGAPIVSSDKEPMPEFLKDGGFYFDAKSISSIKETIEMMFSNTEERLVMCKKNIEEVKKYSWKETSIQTFDFIINVYNKNKENA